jgi:hypothetical protein
MGSGVMGTTQDHRRYAEECIAMAQRADDESDKALWLTLAQSWVRLAEHVARGPSPFEDETTGEVEEVEEAESSSD